MELFISRSQRIVQKSKAPVGICHIIPTLQVKMDLYEVSHCVSGRE